MTDPHAPPLINRLRLMPDQPVEGCELCPDVFLLVRGAHNIKRRFFINPPSSARDSHLNSLAPHSQGGVPAANARLEFHWYRSTEKMACSWCGKTPVTMQRLTDSTYYCGVQCFVSAWPGHAAMKH